MCCHLTFHNQVNYYNMSLLNDKQSQMKLKMEMLHVQRESVNLKAKWMTGQLHLASAIYMTKFAVETWQKKYVHLKEPSSC